MSELEKSKRVTQLLEYKQDIERFIFLVENKDFAKVSKISVRKRNGVALSIDDQIPRYSWFDAEGFYEKFKYLFLAELHDSMDKVQTEINSLVEFKEEQEGARQCLKR